MKSIKVFILFAITAAYHVAYCKYLTVDLSKSENYSVLAVEKGVDVTGAVKWTHQVIHGDTDSIGTIKDGAQVLTKNNRLLKDQVSFYGLNGVKFIKYPTTRGWFSKSTEWACWQKDKKKWKQLNCTIYMYVLNRRTKPVVTWDMWEENKFIKATYLDNNFTKYTLSQNVLVEGIIQNDEALWTLEEAGWNRFDHAYKFDKANLTFFVVAHVSGQDETYYKVLAKGKHLWIPLPSNLSKYVVNIAKDIDYPDKKDTPGSDEEELPYRAKKRGSNGSELPNKAKQRLARYIKAENAKQNKEYQIKVQKLEGEEVIKGVRLDLQHPSGFKSYQLRKLDFVTKKGKIVLAKPNFVFTKVTSGPVGIFKCVKQCPFLLIYTDYHLYRVLNALSYYNGNTHLLEYEEIDNQWEDMETELVHNLFYTVDLDLLVGVDKRLISYRKQMHLGAYSVVYKANNHIGINNIVENGKIVWTFKTPYRGKIYVKGSGKKQVYNFTIVRDGKPIDIRLKRIFSSYYCKYGDYGKWFKLSHYIRSI